LQASIVQDNVTVSVEDFDLLAIIGQGSFGKVVQVRMKATGDIFAMKVLKKKQLSREVRWSILRLKRIF